MSNGLSAAALILAAGKSGGSGGSGVQHINTDGTMTFEQFLALDNSSYYLDNEIEFDAMNTFYNYDTREAEYISYEAILSGAVDLYITDDIKLITCINGTGYFEFIDYEDDYPDGFWLLKTFVLESDTYADKLFTDDTSIEFNDDYELSVKLAPAMEVVDAGIRPKAGQAIIINGSGINASIDNDTIVVNESNQLTINFDSETKSEIVDIAHGTSADKKAISSLLSASWPLILDLGTYRAPDTDFAGKISFKFFNELGNDITDNFSPVQKEWSGTFVSNGTGQWTLTDANLQPKCPFSAIRIDQPPQGSYLQCTANANMGNMWADVAYIQVDTFYASTSTGIMIKANSIEYGEPESTPGTYTLVATVAEDGQVTYSWVSQA